MAAAAQAYLNKVEDKVRPFVSQGPCNQYWSLLEQKAKVKREHAALGLLALLAIYLAFGWANDFLCNLIGFVYPAYASIIAVESKGTADDTEWLVYWVVYAVCGVIEYIGHSFFHNLPFYWLGKCLFLIWLMVPGPNGGSRLLYNRLLHPLAQKLQPAVEKPARRNEYVHNE